MNQQQLEIAAREYCRLAGLNPDSLVARPSPTGPNGETYDVYMTQKKWQEVVGRIKDQLLLNAAIERGIEADVLDKP